jgi:large subunit ribosomal protein L4
MAKIDVYNLKREKVGELTLADEVFAAEVKEHLFYEVVKAQLASRRQGTAGSKNRSAVSGSTKKMLKQKGTGGARHGSKRAPIYVGGGQAHGPRPRDWSYRPPAKVRASALRSALSKFHKEGRLVVVDAFELAEVKTKGLLATLATLKTDKKALVVDASTNDVTASPDVAAVPDVVRDATSTTPDATTAPPDATTAPPDATTAPPDVASPPPDVTAPPPDVSLPPPDGGAAVDPLVAVPTFDAATVARVRELRARGAAMGMRPNVFAKIGDSITESASFLFDIGQGWYVLGPYGALEPTIAYFRATRFADGSNSLSRASSCAMGGWIARYALAMDPMSALRNELSYTRPGYAIVMYGTNDLDRMPPADFLADMNRILDIIEGGGTVPVLSTIPDRLDRPDAAGAVPGYNDAIRGLAAARHLPLMDYWRALQPLPRRGVDTDGIHPSAYIASGDFATGVLTPTALQYGYNMRNLVALLALDRLRALP